MNAKMKSKFFTAMVVTLAVLAVMVANASAEVAWAQSVVSYDPCWSNPDNIPGMDDDTYASSICEGEFCAVVVDVGKVFSNGTVYVNRHYANGNFEGAMGMHIYVSSDASSWTRVGYEEFQDGGDPPPTSDSDFSVTFSQQVRYVKVQKFSDWGEPEPALYVDSVRIVGSLASPDPDLTVTDINASAQVANQSNTVYATIENTGSLDAPSFNVSLSANGTEVDKASVADLSAGASTVVSFTWTPPHSGFYELCVVADCDFEVEETNESNNEMTEMVEVEQPMVGVSPPDILVGYNESIELLVDDTSGGFTSKGEVANISNFVRGLADGDFDNDGNTDFLAGEYIGAYNGNIQLFLSDGSGNFTSGEVVASLSRDPWGITANDFDGDGDIDFLVTAYYTELYLNDGTGNFTYAGRVASTDNACGITSADFDCDGYIDFIVSDMWGTKLYRNNGAGSFTSSGNVAGNSMERGLTSDDFDGDGDYDLLISNLISNHYVIELYINDGTGVFTNNGVAANLSGACTGLTSADFDDDGDVDFVVADNDGMVDMYGNNGTGRFTRTGRITVTSSGHPISVSSGDFAPTAGAIHPDLTPVNVSPSTLFVNITNTIFAIIANNGSTDSGEFNVSFSVEGSVVDTKHVPSLGVGNSTTVSFEWQPESIGGLNITIGVDTENVVWELNETNNTLTRLIPIVQGYADLVPVEITTPENIFADGPNTIGALVSNAEGAHAHAGIFNVSLLADGTPVDVKTIASLPVGDNATVEFNWTPEHTGNHTLTVVVDSDDNINEINETNNELSRNVTVVQGYADLIPTEVIMPEKKIANLSNTISAVIENKGVAHAGGFNVSLQANGTFVDKAVVTALSAGANTTVEFEWVPGHAGNYTLNVIVDIDDDVAESNETNNELSRVVSVLPQTPELIVSDIKAYHYHTDDGVWFNLTNIVKVTINNSGSEAGAFNVSLYIDNESISKKAVPGLGAGNQTEVLFSWTPIGKDCMKGGSPRDYTIEAFVDSDDDVEELNETNNNASITTTVYWNGYSADEPLDNVAHGKIRGGIYYTTGDSDYISGGVAPGESVSALYNITLPEGAKVKLTRLNVYYTWAKGYPEPEISITTPDGITYHDVPLEKSYNDRKCFPGFNNPWGNYVFNLTPYVNGNGIYNVTVKELSSNYPCYAGRGIVIVYEDDSMPLREYWINEGADILIGGRRGDGGGLSLEECINNATFLGSIDLSKVSSAALAVVSPWSNNPWDVGSNVLYFNGVELGRDVYTGYQPIGDISLDGIHMTGSGHPQVGVNLSDVTDYLNASDNVVGQGDNRDCMMPSNAFLVVEYGAGMPQTPFMIYGVVNDSEGAPVTNSNVTVKNKNTGEEFTVETSDSSNFYQVVAGSKSIRAGDVLEFTCGGNSLEHEVTSAEMDAGVLEQNLTRTEYVPPAGFWESYPEIASGLGGTEDRVSLAVFNRSGEWYAIAGDETGGFYGFKWNGSGWQSDTGITAGLGDIGVDSTPTVFNMDGTWYLIAGEYDGAFYGYNWSGSAWQSDDAIVSGLSDIGNNSAPIVFHKDDTWYLIAGEMHGAVYGYRWTGSEWQSDDAIVSGLGSVGGQHLVPAVFYENGTWYLIFGEYYGEFFGFNWTGSGWQSDPAVISGLEDAGMRSSPAVFYMDNTWYLIAASKFGAFYGYKHPTGGPQPPAIMSYAPETPVSNVVGDARTFNISIDQTVNVTWLINGTIVQTNTSVTCASYTNTSAVAGYWNVSAVATNENGTAMQTWWWTVNPAGGICGDVNSDGEVNWDDVITLWYDYADYPTQGAYTISNEWAADVTGDGVINMDDVMTLWYNVTNYPYAGAYKVNCR